MRKAGLEVGEDLSDYGPTQVLGRRLGWRPTPQQGGANDALAAVEASPDALEGFVAAMAASSVKSGVDGRSNATGEGVLEESPQGFRGQAQSSDCAGNPDAEGPSATVPLMAIAAKDPPGADGDSLGFAIVKSGENAMTDEGADDLAVGAGDQFEA